MAKVLITGANRGIGFELTKKYLENNWQVFACCRDPSIATKLHELENDFKNNLVINQLDVKDAGQIQSLGLQYSEEKIDLLINNAGVIGLANETLQNFEANVWLDTLTTNSLAPALMIQAFINQVAASDLKKIANISSVMGSITNMTSGGYYSYRSSKAALNALTKAIALDVRSRHVSVVAIHPGWVQTDMGGADATITPTTSANGIYNVLEKITGKETGEFFSYAGEGIPW